MSRVAAASGPRRRSIFTAHLVDSRAGRGQPRVVDDLRRAILSGDEPPGTLIPVDAVARFFGVSQIPVREALKVLHGEGLVDHVPHVGYSVAQLTFTEFRELYDVRQALEAAALRASVRHADEADDARVEQWYERLSGAVEAGDERAYHAASRGFHMALIAPARMQRLVHMYEAAWNITEPVRPMSRVGTSGRTHLHGDHRDLMAAYLDRDADRLVRVAETHFDHLRAAIESFRADPEVFRPEPVHRS